MNLSEGSLSPKKQMDVLMLFPASVRWPSLTLQLSVNVDDLFPLLALVIEKSSRLARIC